MELSIVIPLYNEEESLRELVRWIDSVTQANKLSSEIILIDDGSTDNSWLVVNEIREEYPQVKGARFAVNHGKSAALHVGFGLCTGDVVISMDADLQDSPDEIPELFRMIMKENYDLVSGWKKKRLDPLSKTIPTKIYNATVKWVHGIRLHDMNCGLKAYKRDVVKSLEVYGEMHRFIPVIAKAAGFNKIGEKVVEHRARKYGKTKFGMNRFINGFLDLLTITFITKYTRRPMHFFGFWGTISALIGASVLGTFGIIKILDLSGAIDPFPLINHIPALFFGTVAFLLGILLFSTGLLAELIGRNSPIRNNYQVKETVGFSREKESVETSHTGS